MAALKRSTEERAKAGRRKRPKISGPQEEDKPAAPQTILPGEIDFPRGGGTSFSPIEYKNIRSEALKEFRDEGVFKELSSRKKKKSILKKTQSSTSKRLDHAAKEPRAVTTRVEHLNYKRVAPGMKVLCQVMAIYPLFLVVSLPGQLFGQVPITNVSYQLTKELEALSEYDEEGSELEGDEGHIADRDIDLALLFRTGQFLRAVVSAVKPHGITDEKVSSHLKDETVKASRRIELSLVPSQVNQGLVKTDLVKGFILTGAVKSIEDHGYAIDIGLADISGFLRFLKQQSSPWRIGAIVDVVIDNFGEDGRTCLLKETIDPEITMKQISNVASVLPGALVDALITSVSPSGLVVQILGSFVGTVDLYHLPSGATSSNFSEGMRIKARILFNVLGMSPPQFALSMKEHILTCDAERQTPRFIEAVETEYPIGTVLPSVTVKRVEPERGLVVKVGEDLEGFVHISHASDEHVPSLAINSGPWRIGSVHRARVIGFHSLDFILQLSLRPSVLSQKFLRVADVSVGEVVKGIVKKLTTSALFVNIGGSVDGVIWPMHYADIRLKHPERRFKPGAPVKARILSVDSDRKRILLTAKRSLIESDLPLICKIDDAIVNTVVHCVIQKVMEKSILVEFYNNVKAIVPFREVNENDTANIMESFPAGKVVKVRILAVDRETSRILASIRQASAPSESGLRELSNIDVGQSVSGIVIEIHRENVLLKLHTSSARALISLNNVANHRKIPVQDLRASLKVGEEMDNLLVVSRNLGKGIAIVANRPAAMLSDDLSTLNLNELEAGTKVRGKVVKHGKRGAVIRFPGRIMGTLHPTDITDDFEQGNAYPPIDATVLASVVSIDCSKKHLDLSTRCSRMDFDIANEVKDREIGCIQDVNIGETVRGFIKSITEHGLFVTIGRDIDARVQIKELFDEYVKDWKSGFEVNQLVVGRVLSINFDKNQIEMSLRSQQSFAPEMSFKDLVVGQKVDGKIKKIEDFGIFIQIEGSKLSGLCHKSEIADNKDADVALALRNFKESDVVRAVILAIDSEKRRISLGLKPSYFSEKSPSFVNDPEDSEGLDSDETIPRNDRNDSASSEDDDAPPQHAASGDALIIADSSVTNLRVDSFENSVKTKTTPGMTLLLPGFQWNADKELTPGKDDSDVSDDGELIESVKKRRKKKAIERDMTADMHTLMPESISDFERYLLASPNSSFLWIQYMSFQLQLSDIDKAKEIGRRALQVINIREEQEKLNVWIALLNLENNYGSEESTEALFKEAARYNDSKTIHLRMADIYDQSEKHMKAEDQYKRTTKKFGQSSKVWTLFGEHYLRRGLFEEARKLLPRSLLSLEKRKHLKTISKFAQLEYKFGEPERGKTIFEGMIDSHPKRWDIWSVYIDMESGQKDVQSIRKIFERVFAQKMTSHKAKAFFKKWLELELRLGDSQGQNIVKERAIEWTQRTLSQP